MTANEKLQDLLLERSLILERIKGSVSNDLTKIYDELFKDISKRINESDLTIKESERLIKLLEKDLVIPYAELGNDLNALAQDESKFMLNAVNAAAGIDIATTLPTNKTINKIANASLMEGATIKNWFGSLEQSLRFDVAREVRQSIIQGKTNREVTDALKAILNTSSRNANTLALTGIATVTNQVRQQTIKENEDIFKGQKTVVTFDNRTSIICQSYSNSSWNMEGKILTGNKAFREPPYHMRCRTILLPIIKSFRELGIDLDEMKGATKASMDGQIPKDMSFDEWLKTKPKTFVESTLGKGRAELFLDGKINLSQLTDLRGNPLTIKELTNIQTPKIVVPKNIVRKVPKIDFIGVKKVKDAEDRIRSLGIGEVSLTGLKEKQYNTVLEAIENEAQLKSLSIDKVVTYRKKNDYSKAIYSPSNKSLHINLAYVDNLEFKELIDYETQLINKRERLAKYKSDFLGNDKYKQSQVRSTINSLNNNIWDLEQKIKNGEVARHHTISSSMTTIEDNLKATIIHEIGHHRHFEYYNGDVVFNFVKKDSISEYGRVNAKEYFAEHYANYRLNGDKNTPKDMLKLFKEIDND